MNTKSASQNKWARFEELEQWGPGKVLWLWAPTWSESKLAIGMEDVRGGWVYESGSRVGAAGEEYPTHFMIPVPPTAPIIGQD